MNFVQQWARSREEGKRYKVVALSCQHFWRWLLVISKSTWNHHTSLNSSSHDVSDPFLIKLDKKNGKETVRYCCGLFFIFLFFVSVYGNMCWWVQNNSFAKGKLNWLIHVKMMETHYMYMWVANRDELKYFQLRILTKPETNK